MTTTLTPDEFESALPLYVNGTLDESARRQVEAYVREHPQAAQAVEWHAALRDTVREEAAGIPVELDWEEYAQKVGLSERRAPGRRSLRELVAARWTLGAPTGLRVFAACAAVLVVVQTGLIAHLLGSRPAQQAPYAVDRSATPAMPLLDVRFHVHATEPQIRQLLLELDARIVDGPSQLGAYTVELPAEQAQAAERALRASPMVKLATPHHAGQ